MPDRASHPPLMQISIATPFAPPLLVPRWCPCCITLRHCAGCKPPILKAQVGGCYERLDLKRLKMSRCHLCHRGLDPRCILCEVALPVKSAPIIVSSGNPLRKSQPYSRPTISAFFPCPGLASGDVESFVLGVAKLTVSRCLPANLETNAAQLAYRLALASRWLCAEAQATNQHAVLANRV